MATVRKNYREESRKNYGTDTEDGVGITMDQLNAGSLMRIADATELMARNFLELQADRDKYKRWYESEQSTVKMLRDQLRTTKAAKPGRLMKYVPGL